MPRRSASSSSKNHSPYSRSQSRTPNGYIIFCKFYKETLGKEYPNLSPQERMAKTGEMWNSLPNDLKNSFITFASHDRILKTQSKLDCQCLTQATDQDKRDFFSSRCPSCSIKDCQCVSQGKIKPTNQDKYDLCSSSCSSCSIKKLLN